LHYKWNYCSREKLAQRAHKNFNSFIQKKSSHGGIIDILPHISFSSASTGHLYGVDRYYDLQRSVDGIPLGKIACCRQPFWSRKNCWLYLAGYVADLCTFEVTGEKQDDRIFKIYYNGVLEAEVCATNSGFFRSTIISINKNNDTVATMRFPFLSFSKYQLVFSGGNNIAIIASERRWGQNGYYPEDALSNVNSDYVIHPNEIKIIRENEEMVKMCFLISICTRMIFTGGDFSGV